MAVMLLVGCASRPPGPGEAFGDFIKAFNERDLPRFIGAFEPDATIFFDLSEPPGRVSGREKIREVFAPFFASARGFQLAPVEVVVQRSDDIAVISFHLVSPDGLARRSLVWRFSGGAWRIWHLHASSVETEAQ